MTRPSRRSKPRPGQPSGGWGLRHTRYRRGSGGRGNGRPRKPLQHQQTSALLSERSSGTSAAQSPTSRRAQMTSRCLPRAGSHAKAARRRSTVGIAERGIAREPVCEPHMQRPDLVPLPILGLRLLPSLCAWRWAVGLRLSRQQRSTVEERLLRAGALLAGRLNTSVAARYETATVADVCSPKTRPVPASCSPYFLRAGMGWIL
jgi:hypothetical protein